MNKHQEDISQTGDSKNVDRLYQFMFGVTFVMFLALITLVLQYFSATQATYQNLVNQVADQNAKINTLILLNAKK